MKEHELLELQAFAGVMQRAGQSLHTTMRYVFAISDGDFYNVNVKDIFKVALTDITNPDILVNLGLSLDGKIKELDTEEFEVMCDMIFFAFAVRVPFYKKIPGGRFSDKQLLALFSLCEEMGARDVDSIIGETFKPMLKRARGSRGLNEPPFNGEWFRRWIYTYGGELAAINNRNMFFLGCCDALFPLYYAKLTDKITEMIGENKITP
ncbi:MAG: hypothetical protein FWD34_06960 [Oscillospiraceae bacterium]|nr:hypothetical protein [Oscillospiraceae bacterium]